MKRLIVTVAVIVGISFLAPQFAEASGKGAHWGYSGENGPNNWGNLSPEYSDCRKGTQQSPIDISRTVNNEMHPIKTSYKSTPLKVLNNGHAIQVNYSPGSYMTVGSHKYNLLQFHFHSPSENKVKGQAYDMEMHLVHKADNGEIAVLAVFLKKGGKNAVLQKIWDNMPLKAGQTKSSGGSINVTDLLSSTKSYWHFTGSFTTPPCTENVVWNVLQNPITVSESQVKKFLSVIGEDARPVQPVNTRTIYGN
ncbi:Carbonic anhydrase, alpha class [hydrothermal vent metagenome]|uniref:carbonic anhydrase n=1 Tax=hydrothermal vent metagenome TaxID=652676 RepID=A0A3B1BVQ3_9ZZZZ